ncbi:3-methyladenine DNA glycosylase [Sulfurospirillum sp. T05]|uniref:3-methyladenine DNA glycosylase n=1 Tax=Sulfurospirillum tamanense TaxID=2813362 RepID=A0ABS2WQJ8_9BACT|nr:3-methyladenine DNA glycosylase [Sulfurospirillum tamanensis]MBN2963892.1 3-methyladenine DNA glycosylase [Sulfurospirillum tamanensis]
MRRSIELLGALKNAGFAATSRDPFWWPNSGTFEVVVGVVLTQQAKWERVEESLALLRKANALHVKTLAQMNEEKLKDYIRPSGCFNAKAKTLIRLSRGILEEFETFEVFAKEVSREWLLAQKGIGPESADSILCYACYKEAMVVDSYTNRLLRYYGYTFESYEMLQEWLIEGLEEAEVAKLYERTLSRVELYARFHGKIVEFCKEKVKGGEITQGVPGLSLED